MPSTSLDRKDLRGAASAALATEIPFLTDNDLFAWGIDFSSKKVNLAMLTGDANPSLLLRSTEPVDANLPLTARLSTHYHRSLWLFRHIAKTFPPAAVSVELPVGTHPKPILGQTMGVILLALASVLGTSFIYDQPTPTDWKLTVIGKGNANKPEIEMWFDEYFRDQVKHMTLTQDDYDAAAVATECRLWLKGAS